MSEERAHEEDPLTPETVEPKTVRGTFDRRLEPFAMTIGELCVEWARLEGWINQLFLAVGRWAWFDNHVAVDMIRCIDIRDQVKAIRIGSVSRALQPAIYDAIIDCMDYIDQHLRPIRNRFVHDAWMPTDDKNIAHRFENTPYMGRSFDQTFRFVHPGKVCGVHIDEIKTVIRDILMEAEYINLLTCVVVSDPVSSDDVQLPERPPRPLLPAHKEKQRQQAQSIAKPPRQRKPSAASRRETALKKSAP